MDIKGKKKPERSDRYKQGETPLLQVFGKDMVKGKMLSGEGSNFNKLVRLLKHLDSCVSRVGRCSKLLSTTLRTSTAAQVKLGRLFFS